MSIISELRDPIPFKYVGSLEHRKHIALLYEEPEYARMIEFQFIKNGLACGEKCVYATSEESGSIVLKMLRYGISFEHFEQKRIRVYQIREGCANHDELVKKSEKELKTILEGLMPPFRIVSRIVPDVSTLDGISVELEIEYDVHKKFDMLGGFVMCPYEISHIEPTRRKEWITALYKTHHDVIYAPKFGQGGVFCTR